MAFDVGSVVATIKADISDFKKGISDAQQQAHGFTSSLGTIGDGLATIGKQAALFSAAVGVGFGLVGKYALDGAAKFEQYQIAFTTLLGSQQAASAAIRDISIDAAKTPFELAPLVMANQRLISAGINAKDARKDILNLGDAISATGGGNAELERLSTNLQQIKAVGKASALDIKQFAFAGINVYDMLAKSTGKSVEQVRNMDVTYEVLADSFAKASAAGGRFHGAMEAQSLTLNGLMSTLHDTISLGLKDILMQSGAFDLIRNAIAGLIPFLNDLVPKIVAFFQALPRDPTFAMFLNILTIAFSTFSTWVSQNQQLVMTFLQGLAIGLTALLVIGTITALLNPFVLVVAGVSLAIATFYTAYQSNFLGIRDITNSVVNEVMNFFNNYLMPVIAALTAFIQAHWSQIVAMTQGTFLVIEGIFQVAWAIIYGIIKVFLALMVGDWGKAWEAVKASTDLGWEGIKNIFNGIISFLSGWGGWLFDSLTKPFRDAWNTISDLINKIRDGLDFTKRHSPSVVDLVERGVDKVNSAMAGLNFGLNAPAVAGASIVSNGGSVVPISVNIDMGNALISDSSSAERLGEMVGDSIIRKLQGNLRF